MAVVYLTFALSMNSSVKFKSMKLQTYSTGTSTLVRTVWTEIFYTDQNLIESLKEYQQNWNYSTDHISSTFGS